MLTGIAALVIVIVLVFLVLTHRETSDKNISGNQPANSQDREPGENVESTEEEKLRRLNELNELFLSRKMEEFLLEVPEPSYEDAAIRRGQVFLYGQYLPPPYKVEIIGERLLLNDIPLEPGLWPTGGVTPKVTPEVRRAHETGLIIRKMMEETDFGNREQIDQLLQKVLALDAVESAQIDVGGIWVRFRGLEMPILFLRPRTDELTEQEQVIRDVENMRKTKEHLEEYLKNDGVLFWFSRGRLWGFMAVKDVPDIVRKINNILKKQRPKPDQTVDDFADEKRLLHELLPSLDSWHIAEIIVNWKRK